ncbi:MAG TPA: SDR family NAD(P)-dependent oxidoreductase, partial [Rhodanobacteraceae bacterium]
MPRNDQYLSGQNALVTGANSGIGEAVARELAARGANVVVNYVVQPDVAQKIVDEINAGTGGKAIAIKADVSKEDEVRGMFADAVEEFGTLDIVCSNAGIQRDSDLVDMTMQQWDQVIGVNLTGAFLCAREAAREFTRRGMRDVSSALGKIIFTSSVHQVIPWAGHANYA